MFSTLANQITILRILLIFPFIICSLNTRLPDYGHWIRGGAVLIFLIMAISDALDGYLARKNKQVTALGAFLDPMADKLMITCASIVLCAPPTAIEEPFQLSDRLEFLHYSCVSPLSLRY